MECQTSAVFAGRNAAGYIARLHLKRSTIQPAELLELYGYLLPRVLPLRPRETLDREFYEAENSPHLEQQIQDIQSAW